MNRKVFISFFDKNMISNFLFNSFLIRKFYGADVDIVAGSFYSPSSEEKKIINNLKIDYKVISDFDIKLLEKYKMINNSINATTILRLYMYDLFPELSKWKNAVYLDADLIINKKLDEQYFKLKNFVFRDCPKNNIALKERIIIFWRDTLKSDIENTEKIIEKINQDNYFNAGVIIINNHQQMKKLLTRAINSKIKFDDQTILNLINSDELVIMDDLKMNNQIKHGFINDSFISHFSGDWKPWKIFENEESKMSLIHKTNYFDFLKEFSEYKKNILTSEKTITLLVTFHDKTYDELKRLIESLKNINKNDIDVLFIYREASEEILKLLDDYKDTIKVKKISEGRKNAKIIKSKNYVNSKYIQVVDPDDYIDSEILNQAVSFIKEDNKDVDIYLNTHYENRKLIEDLLPKNHSCIFNKNLLELVNPHDNKISQDVYFCMVLFLSSNHFKEINFPFYNYEIDRSNSKHTSSSINVNNNRGTALNEYKKNLEHITKLKKEYKFNNFSKKVNFYSRVRNFFEKRIFDLSNENGIEENSIIENVIVSWWPNNNLGDDLLVASFVENTDFSNYYLIIPEKVSQENKKSMKSIRTLINKDVTFLSICKIIEIKNKQREKFINVVLGGSIWPENSLNFRLANKKLMYQNNIEIIYMGGNLSIYKKEKTIETIKEITESSKLFVLRDKWSHSLLPELSSFHHDPVYSLNLDKYIKKTKKGKVSITTALPDSVFNFSFKKENLINRVFQILEDINSITEIVLLNFQNSKDNSVNLELMKLIKDKFNDIQIKIVRYNDDPSKILENIAESEFTLCTRFHSIVISVLLKKNFFPIYYDNKNENHIKDIAKKNSQYLISDEELIKIRESSKEQFKKLKKVIRGEDEL